VLDLVAAVRGVGPGGSLNAKAWQIQASIAAGAKANACAQLVALRNEVRAQMGKSISQATATAILREAGRVAASLGC
jgi:hypothetical protein